MNLWELVISFVVGPLITLKINPILCKNNFKISGLFPMKLIPIILTTIVVLGLFACNQTANKENQFDCSSLTDKQVIYTIAKSIIGKHDNKEIWNLGEEVDTSDFFTTEDYFTNPRTKNRLVLVGGNAGMSSGNADNLLILFSCADTLSILWSGQIGDIDTSNIIDLNGDGIKEIICNSGRIWMGEYSENYTIFNFKGGEQNYLFKARSISFLDCGRDDFEIFTPGDTVEHILECTLVQLNDKAYTVRQVQTTKIHNGGKTENEIIKNLKVFIDTITVNLKY